MDKDRISNDRAKRLEELSKQEELIARRKQEILARLNSKNIITPTSANPNVRPSGENQSLGPSSSTKSFPSLPKDTRSRLETKPLPDTLEKSNDESSPHKPIKISLPIINKFKNDGSFLEQFKSLQNTNNKKREDSKVKKFNNVKVERSGHESTTGTSKINCEPCPDLKTNSSTISTIQQEIDNALRLVRQESTRRMSLKSLSSKSGPQPSQLPKLNQSSPGSSLLPCTDTMMSYGDMHWSSERTVDANKDPALCQYAKQVFGTTDLSGDQWKQLEDQRKIKALFEAIHQRFDIQPAQSNKNENIQRTKMSEKDNKKHKYAYDSDEEIDPNEGTWEHKKRRKEMEKTKDWAQSLTAMNKGKHHLGDYLPPQELEKFMKKWESIQAGNMSQLSKTDYDDFKIQCDNLGYKMMMKLGWKEGQGLGCGEIAETSIKEPIKVTSNYNGAGLGSGDPTELKEGDDLYEAYRKRMMLAYRFRPNPLNNPRRPYY